ncbi:MAG: WG repeat-containing protein [Planctomycetes bacterium]|nr:WG repeat-containing protein [Planctomycetota bacterium]
MGIDISTESGVLVPLKDFLKALTIGQEELERMVRSLREAIANRSDLADDLKGLKLRDGMTRAEFLKGLYGRLKRTIRHRCENYGLFSADDLGDWLDSVVRGEAAAGVIDRAGKWLVEPRFDEIRELCDECAAALEQGSQLWGFIDRHGQWLIPPQFYGVGDFKDGLALAWKDGRWGVVDKSGRCVIGPRFRELHGFNEGLAVAAEDQLFGFIDTSGAWVIPPQFELALSFGWRREGLAEVVRNGERGLINKRGEWLVGLGSITLWSEFVDGLAPASEGLEDGNQLGFVDENARWAIPPQFQFAESFRDGLALVIQGGLFGFIDKTGGWVIRPQYEMASAFRHGIAAAQLGDRCGVIDRAGAWVIEPCFLALGDSYDFKWFQGGIEPACGEDGLWGAIDRSGEWRVPPTFPMIGRFAEGLADAQDETALWGLIDASGRWVVPAQFEELSNDEPSGISPITKNWIRVRFRSTIFRKCPRITSVIASKGARLTDLWQVAAGEPYVVFSEDDCFLKQLSPCGEALAKLLGRDSLESSAWADYSF